MVRFFALLCAATAAAAFSPHGLGGAMVRPGGFTATVAMPRVAVQPTALALPIFGKKKAEFKSVAWSPSSGWQDDRVRNSVVPAMPSAAVAKEPMAQYELTTKGKAVVAVLLATIAVNLLASAKVAAFADSVVSFAFAVVFRTLAHVTAFVDAVASFAMALVLRLLGTVILPFELAAKAIGL